MAHERGEQGPSLFESASPEGEQREEGQQDRPPQDRPPQDRSGSRQEDAGGPRGPSRGRGGERGRERGGGAPRPQKAPQVKVFLEGRYRKLSRDLPQTVFFCPDCKGHPRRRRKCERCEGFGKLTRDSVQELVAWVIGSAFKTRKNKFHGAGREDVDVRMLGEGRPFVLELIDPKQHDVDLAEVEAEINRRNEGRLEVRGLHWTEKARVRALKEAPRAKEYEALVRAAGPLDEARAAELVGRRVQVVQQTPERVAHRRAQKDRERWLEVLAIEPAERPEGADAPEGATWWRVRVRTEHGTYVKEAIHGEGGCTRPSLSELLGVPCDCVELDVLAILDAPEDEEAARRAERDSANFTFGHNVF